MRKLNEIYEQSGYLVKNGKPVHRQVYKSHHKDIPPIWHVHHIDFDKKNNDIANLIAVPSCIHNQIHKYSRSSVHIYLGTIKKWVRRYLKNRPPSKKKKKKDKKKQIHHNPPFSKQLKKLEMRGRKNNYCFGGKKPERKIGEERKHEIEQIEQFLATKRP